ncbi:MAG: pantothenate kinase [Cyanobacteria bacterium J06598_1]
MRNGEPKSAPSWLALVIGNTRLHWGYWYQGRFVGAWHTPHLTAAIAAYLHAAHFRSEAWQSVAEWSGQFTPAQVASLPTVDIAVSDLWVASAVPEQSVLWMQPECSAQVVVRSQIPLTGIYPTLGIDRAINLLGAGQLAGWPVLVIDAGTAITLTAGVAQAVFGGAILPGLRLQREALSQRTAVLGTLMPQIRTQSEGVLPERWAVDTEGAIASGLIYGILSTLTDYIHSWWQQYPEGKAIFTGGDAPYLYQCLQQRTPEVASRVLVNIHLMFDGMSVYRSALI